MTGFLIVNGNNEQELIANLAEQVASLQKNYHDNYSGHDHNGNDMSWDTINTTWKPNQVAIHIMELVDKPLCTKD